MARHLKSISAAFSLCLVAGSALPALAEAVPYAALPSVTAAPTGRSAQIVMDAVTGEVLYEINADQIRYPASVTKVMTLYLAFEALAESRIKTQDLVPISARAAAQQPTKLGLKVGSVITVENAMRAVAVKSSNDIALALAEKIGGSEERFAALMTLRAQELGMSNTRFTNASGLPDPRNVTTARDMATLSRAILRDFPQYYTYFGQRYFDYHGKSMANHNSLLHSMPGVDGIKTGFTSAAGYNLAASAVRDDQRLIAVVLAGSSKVARNVRVENLLDAGFDVLRRRDRGESITLAQSLNESAPPTVMLASNAHSYLTQSASGTAIRPVVLAKAPVAKPAPKPVLLAAVTKPAPATTTSVALRGAAPIKPPVKPKDQAREKEGGDWLVQVGAFTGRAQASAQITLLQRSFKELFGDADGFVEGAENSKYRARFKGMTADDARKACQRLSAKRQPCMVVAPPKK